MKPERFTFGFLQFVCFIIFILCCETTFASVRNPPPLKFEYSYIEGQYVPGAVTIKLKPAAQSTSRRLNSVAQGQFGVDSLDSKIKNFGGSGLKQLFTSTVGATNSRSMARATELSDSLSRIYRVTFPETSDLKEIVNQLASDENVEYAEPVSRIKELYTPNDPVFNVPNNPVFTNKSIDNNYNQRWWYDKIGIEQAWDITNNYPSSVIIGIIDTGVQIDHPDLAGKVEYAENFSGGATNTVTDNEGHGTHLSGIIAANRNNGIGIAGTCPNCLIAFAKGADDPGDTNPNSEEESLEYLADLGVKVINMSFGMYFPTEAEYEAIQYAQGKGVILVAAAGNQNTKYPLYPAAYPGVVAVAATDQNDLKANFSNYGNWVDISAPGVDICSTEPTSTYVCGDGTSFAAPIVSGVLGLMLSMYTGTTPEELISALLVTSDKIDAANPSYAGMLGAGRVNAGTLISLLKGNTNYDEWVTITAPKGRSIYSGNVTVSWNDYEITPISHYFKVCLSTDNGNTYYWCSNQTTQYSMIIGTSNLTNGIPYQFAVVAIDGNGNVVGKAISADSFTVLNPTSNILLVDGTSYLIFDPNYNQYELAYDPSIGNTYKQALTQLGIGYDSIVTHGFATVPVSILSQYIGANKAVIWFTGQSGRRPKGNISSNSLYPIDQPQLFNIAQFLDNGGKMILSSQDFANDYHNIYPDFLTGFGISFVSDGFNYTGKQGGVTGYEGDPITVTNKTPMALFNSGDGVNNQDSPDVIQAVPPALPILKYDANNNRGVAAVRETDGNFRLVYFAFGLESLNTANYRKTLLGNSLNWLLNNTPEGPAKIIFSDSLPATAAGIDSAPITIELLGESGNPAPAGTGGITLYLFTSSSTGHFLNPTYTVPQGQTQATFIYMDTTAGNPIITVSDSNPPESNTNPPIGITDATGTISIFVDTTPPSTIATVNDGAVTGADIAFSSSTTQLSANWTASTDPIAGIDKYWYAIGTTPGGTNILSWIDNGGQTSVTRTGLALTNEQTYYFTVKAQNGVGLQSAVTNSNGQKIDTTGPMAITTVYDGAVTGAEIAYATSTTQLSANWPTSTDPESGIAKYWYAIGTTAGGMDVVGWTNNGVQTSVTKTGLALSNGATYYFTVKAENGAGIQSAATNSNGQKVDSIPPNIQYIYDGTGAAESVYATSTTQLSANWTAADTISGITKYWYAIGTTSGGTDVVGWTDNGLLTYVTKTGLSLTNGRTYYFMVKAVNRAGLTSTLSSYGQRIDVSPPSLIANVYDGSVTGMDIDVESSMTQLSANWSASTDNISGIAKYWYAIGTTAGATDVVGWTANGGNTHVTRTGLSLTWGQTYYFTVKAENGAGLQSAATNSNGQKVGDTTPPTKISTVYDGAVMGAEIEFSTSTTQLLANWSASTDNESAIAKYWYAIGTTAGATDVIGWTDDGLNTSVTRTGLSLAEGQKYYFTVKAENGVGLFSNPTSSNGVIISGTGALLIINQGWNQIGISRQNTSISPETIFGSLLFEIVQFNSQNGVYNYMPKTGTVSFVQAGGYWIYSEQNIGVLSVGGTDYGANTFSLNLNTGWNMFSNPFNQPESWGDDKETLTCGGTAESLQPVYFYTTGTGYTTIQPNADKFLIPWQGYLMFIPNSGCILSFSK